MAANIALLSGPQDPSQLQASLNALIEQINGFIGGSTPQTALVQNATTSANIPQQGVVVMASTVAGAVYTLGAPAQIGQGMSLVTNSTKSQTVVLATTKLFYFKNRTKITVKNTNVGIPQAIELVARSSTVWGIRAVAGNVKCT